MSRTVYSASQDPDAALWDKVRVDGHLLPPTARAIRHSPSGYGWGYLGSAPAALAHAILAHATDSLDVADESYQRFKAQHVAHWNDGWRITRGAVLRWLQYHQAGVEAPQVWCDCPPDPPEQLLDWLEHCPLAVYSDVAALAYHRADGQLGDLLEEHGLDRIWVRRICANLPESWLEGDDDEAV